MTEIKPQKSQRIVELDALRALAAINLMLFHFTHVYSVKYGYAPALGFEWPYGKYGVQLFFMLSGLVNAMTLTKLANAGEFVARRMIRILPAFLLVIVLNVLLLSCPPISLHESFRWDQVLANLTVVPNLLGYECLEPVTWTLQIEVLFYGALAVLFLGGAWRQPARTMLCYLAVCLVLRTFLSVLQANPPDDASLGFVRFVCDVLVIDYIPLFAIGVMLYELRCGRGDRRLNWICLFASLIVFHLIDQRDHHPVATLGFTVMLGLAACGRIPLLRTRPLLFVSSISYSLYLLHNNLGCVIIYHLNQIGIHSIICFAVSMPLMIGISAAISIWIEQPLALRMRRGWQSFRERRTAADRVSPAMGPTPLAYAAAGHAENAVRTQRAACPQTPEVKP